MRYSCQTCHGLITPDVRGAYQGEHDDFMLNHGWVSVGENWFCPVCSKPFCEDLPAYAGKKSKKAARLIVATGKDYDAAAGTIAKLKNRLETEITDLEFTEVEKIERQIEREEKKQFYFLQRAELYRKSMIETLAIDARAHCNKNLELCHALSRRTQEIDAALEKNENDRRELMEESHRLNIKYRTLSQSNIELKMVLDRL